MQTYWLLIQLVYIVTVVVIPILDFKNNGNHEKE
jgi:hypothetical protein